MSDRATDDIVALLPPLLRALDRLAFAARYLHPGDLPAILEACGDADLDLAAERPRLDAWPDQISHVRAPLAAAADEALAGFQALRAAADTEGDLTAAFRAFRHLPRAEEALFPLTRGLPPVSRFFLDGDHRDDMDLAVRLAEAPPRPDVGVLHSDAEPGGRGGFSMFVPETYEPDRPLPLVMALHGGSGNGRAFLWSWVRAARTRGAIVVAPTAIGQTWALTGDDVDTPNLDRIVQFVRSRWAIDPRRLLLTGMSDGGTFTYVSGLEPTSPFTHLAPVSAAFHPMLASFADPGRLSGLPIHIVHGAMDWMFPIVMAREAARSLQNAGASVTYREVDDLSHTYAREVSAGLLDWMADA